MALIYKQLKFPSTLTVLKQNGGPVRGYLTAHPVTGKKPPTLEEFDPLNPGDWQLGAAGKILPRLPEGTRVGTLVMGKLGLYDPKIRARQEGILKAYAQELPSEQATAFDRRCSQILKIFVFISIPMIILHTHMLLNGKLVWPFTEMDARRKAKLEKAK